MSATLILILHAVPTADISASVGVAGCALAAAGLQAVSSLRKRTAQDPFGWEFVSVLVAAIVGLAAAAVGLLWTSTIENFVLAGCMGIILLVWCLEVWRVLRRRRAPADQTKARRRLLTSPFLPAFAILMAAGAALIVWLIVAAGDVGDTDQSEALGLFEVRGTDTDHIGTVNECATPKRCGIHNIGRIREGERVEIECQVRGGVVKAEDGRSSSIWDRLTNGAYVTDLYISTPVKDAFTPKLGVCEKSGG